MKIETTKQNNVYEPFSTVHIHTLAVITNNMNSELKYIFGNVNEWLKFSEAKHAGLIVLNSAIIIGVVSAYSNISVFEKAPAIISLSVLGISIFLSLVAQFPITSNFLIREDSSNQNPNIYFFGDLSKISESDFISEFKKSNTSFNATASDKNLINQILVNSKITASKFLIFKFCCYLSTFGIGLLGISTIIKIIWL
ncbi:MAG: DUF5706 domain-containing protein [Bacteroidetes bacterium]|nr:DUF5706 domain-containing protein [Bacteroidota bacterium]